MARKLIRINPRDNVAVALEPLFKGDVVTVDGDTFTIFSDIPGGHKVALSDIKKEEKIIKYGYPIGAAKEDIEKGQHVHAFNIHTLLSEDAEYTYDRAQAEEAMREAEVDRARWKDHVPMIKAYKRQNGKIGIRNALWIVPTVGCVNRIAEKLEAWGNETLGIEDGVHAWIHPFGCSQMGGDHENTRKILADLAHHPNAGGVLVLGLGCENNTMDSFKELLGPVDSSRVKFLVAQESEDEIADAKKLMSEANLFFKGMGEGFSKVVILIVAASTMVAGLAALGIIDRISSAISNVENAESGLIFAFSGITALITFISGSGNAVFYSFIELIPQIAERAGIDPIMVALPMQCTSHLFRAISPVAAVVIIVSAVIRENPLNVVKRTAVPMIAGEIAVMVAAWIRYM